MKLIWKIPLFLTVVLLVGLAVIYVYLLSYDFNRLKPGIISAVKDVTGRNLSIEGDIKVSIGLTPALVIENVAFQNAQWGARPEMLQIKRFEMQLALLPLFSGTLEVRRAALIDADFFIEVNQKGALNLPALGEAPPGSAGRFGRSPLSAGDCPKRPAHRKQPPVIQGPPGATTDPVETQPIEAQVR